VYSLVFLGEFCVDSFESFDVPREFSDEPSDEFDESFDPFDESDPLEPFDPLELPPLLLLSPDARARPDTTSDPASAGISTQAQALQPSPDRTPVSSADPERN
jgi:hypothetical protein